eukprot:g23276.t1
MAPDPVSGPARNGRGLDHALKLSDMAPGSPPGRTVRRKDVVFLKGGCGLSALTRNGACVSLWKEDLQVKQTDYIVSHSQICQVEEGQDDCTLLSGRGREEVKLPRAKL